MKENTKVWLCGITNSGNEENLKELISPVIEYFDGLVWTFHYPKDEGAEFLEKNKKDGEIIYAPWRGRYDFARNHYLFSGNIKEGDWFFNIDTEERISKEFCRNMPEYLESFEKKELDSLFYEGKFLAFKFNEWMHWKNSIHECVTGNQKGIELKGCEPFDDDPIRTNLRSLKRGKFDIIKQALRYYLTPASIHCLLGCEKVPELYKKRMEVRHFFRQHMMELNIDPTDTEAVLAYIISDEADEDTQKCVEFEKYLNDAYRYYKLGEEELEHIEIFFNKRGFFWPS